MLLSCFANESAFNSVAGPVLGVRRGCSGIHLARTRLLIRVPQQLNRAVYVTGLAQKYADPSAVWQDVVTFRSSRGYQFFANLFCEGDIDEGIAVDVPNFSSVQAILCSAEAVWRWAGAISPGMMSCRPA